MSTLSYVPENRQHFTVELGECWRTGTDWQIDLKAQLPENQDQLKKWWCTHHSVAPIVMTQPLLNCPITNNTLNVLMHLPFCGRVSWHQRTLELYHLTASLLKFNRLLRVVLHQLSEGGKLLTPIQIIALARILNPDVGDALTPPEWCHSTLARFALTRVSLARFTLTTFILTRFQFGAFLFGALPRFPILYEPTMIRYLRTPVSRGEELSTSFCARSVSVLRACFLSQ